MRYRWGADGALIVTKGETTAILTSADDPEMWLQSREKEDTPAKASTNSHTVEEKRSTGEGKPRTVPKIHRLGVRKL
ncbi:Hypothetical predicted protein [Pelobates cultripes]|uniref:Uncharacterized protein n=1 Tax=Pelobates cultripes TaxID=61616 RepID=A0AAD1RFC3_PELCU|nr:Hypothetical predicted protein [Pelobates cultripes]